MMHTAGLRSPKKHDKIDKKLINNIVLQTNEFKSTEATTVGNNLKERVGAGAVLHEINENATT